MQLTSQSALVCFVALFLRTLWEKALTNHLSLNHSDTKVKTMKSGKARCMKVANEARPGLVPNLGTSLLCSSSSYPSYPSSLPPFLSSLLFFHLFLLLPYIQGMSYVQRHLSIIYHNPPNLQMGKTKAQIRQRTCPRPQD